tara:strand:- start:848 stop:1765 length:918 start_codon:yes stop_codon:yes gene_type:complete
MLDNLVFKRVKADNLDELINLFKKVFKIRITKKFYNWRYCNKSYTSFVALYNKNIIAHIGFVKYNFNNCSNILYSRHSTFVIPKFQNKGVYYKLLNYSFSILKTNASFVIAWPNQKNILASKNHANFNIVGKYNLFYKNYRLNVKKNFFQRIDIKFFQKLKIDQDNHLFFKDKKFIKWRYFDYKKNQYFYLNIKNLKNFIFEKNEHEKKNIYSIVDYYGRFSNYDSDLNKLIRYLSKNKISFQLLLPNNYILLDSLFNNEKVIKKRKFYVGLYFIGNKKRDKTKIEKKIKDVIKISDTDVFIKTY